MPLGMQLFISKSLNCVQIPALVVVGEGIYYGSGIPISHPRLADIRPTGMIYVRKEKRVSSPLLGLKRRGKSPT